MLRRIRTILVSALLVAAAVYLATPPTVQPCRNKHSGELGFLEHRGQKYWIKDLMDPAYRAASHDAFVKQFDQGIKFADLRAVSDRRSESFSRRSKARERLVIPWAGQNLDAFGDE